MLSVIAFVLCSIAAVLKAIAHDWSWVVLDVACAVLNAKPAFEWLKDRR